ncbi:hypothetical protein BBJ28_00008270 [Nothophytophthora sp. Chile5]|nr:hypothetical protein BBJ28_00008270 [Nothophytophthora sp. Chile5]
MGREHLPKSVDGVKPDVAGGGGGWRSARCRPARILAVAAVHVSTLGAQLKERRDALKLLRKVEQIVAEVAVRLMHLENQAEDFVANEGKEDASEPAESEDAANSSLNSYYHFDSQGNKLKTKWDSYDVDAELERLEKEEHGENAPASTADPRVAAPKKSLKVPQVDKKKLVTTAAGIEHEFEAVLEFLDDIRGDEQVKQQRKSLVTKITKEHFARVDLIRKLLA